MKSIEELKCSTQPALAEALKPFLAAHTDPRFYDKEQLWAAIGGFKGIRAIRKAAGAISLLARHIADDHPEARSAATELFVGAVYLRKIALLCYVEGFLCKHVPVAPRILAWTVAQHYVDMIGSLEAIESM